MELIESIESQAVPDRSVAVWWMGQGSLVLKPGRMTIWLDPFLSEMDRRLMAPPVRPDQVTNADIVLLTHDHMDHIDEGTLPALAKASPDAIFVAPNAHAERVRSLIGDADLQLVDDGDTRTFGSIEVIPVPAAHEQLQIVEGKGHAFLGYVVRANGLTIYCAGDTTIYPGMVERLSALDIDLAFLPINGRDFFRTAADTIGNMDFREAAELANCCGFRTVVPVHWGMFAGNTVPPGYFVSYAAEQRFGFTTVVPALAVPWIYAVPGASST